MASDDTRYDSDSDFQKLLNLVRSRNLLEMSLNRQRPICFRSDVDTSLFNFCNESFYVDAILEYDYTQYAPEDSNLALQPSEQKIAKLFNATVPVLIYLGTAASKRTAGYSAVTSEDYGEISPSQHIKSATSAATRESSFTQNSYFSFWFSLHPMVRQQILDVISSLSNTLGVDPICSRQSDVSSCRSNKAKVLLRVVSALRANDQSSAIPQLLQSIRPDTNTARPIGMIKSDLGLGNVYKCLQRARTRKKLQQDGGGSCGGEGCRPCVDRNL